MESGGLIEKVRELKALVESLECRVKALEKAVRGGSEITLMVEVPRVILEKKPLDIRISEEELTGRIIMLVREGFFDDGKTSGDVANELMRRCWHPKDLKHVRPALEHLTALGILDRTKEKRKRGKGVKWVYRKGENFKVLESRSP